MVHTGQFAFKKIGYQNLSGTLPANTLLTLHSFIKIVFLKAGSHAIVDFKEYHLAQDGFFFINAGQYFWFDDNCNGAILFYNRDFYCVEIHDKEVACDGILFHNIYDVPVVLMDTTSSANLQLILKDILSELELNDSGMEEMLRILLKQLIIKCTRLWKLYNTAETKTVSGEVEFLRSFSQLVERNYLQHHTVAAYAGLLHISAKALNKRITRYCNTTPNDLIKNRIILEAKRLLVHTSLSIKEISYQLGYEDTSYFTRLFTKQVTNSPIAFRTKYRNSDQSNWLT